MTSQIEKIVSDSLGEILVGLSDEFLSLDYRSDSAVLFGGSGVLDSISLVSLILLVEEKLQNELKTDILLVNEKAMSQKNSPFRTFNSFVAYVNSLILSE